MIKPITIKSRKKQPKPLPSCLLRSWCIFLSTIFSTRPSESRIMNFAILRNVNYKRVLLISRKNTIFFLNKEKKKDNTGKYTVFLSYNHYILPFNVMTFQCINEKKCEISEKSAIFAIALLHITEKKQVFPYPSAYSRWKLFRR